MADHHTHERRFGRALTRNQFSCAIYRATPANLKTVKPLLLYEMEWRYCIKCNASHWFLGEKLEFVQSEFNPNDHETVALEKMGFFAQFADASGE